MAKYLLILLIFCGCSGRAPISSSPTNNPEIKVDLMFEHEGCRVYRVEGNFNNYSLYYTDCNSVHWIESYPCGKTTCTRPRSVPGGNK